MFDVPLLEARYRLQPRALPAGGRAAPRPAAPRAAAVEGAARVVPAAVAGGGAAAAAAPRRRRRARRSRTSTSTACGAATRGRWRACSSTTGMDIVSLAALAVLACQWVEERRAEDPRDIYSLARVLERGAALRALRGRVRRALAAGSDARARAARCCGSRCARQARGRRTSARPSSGSRPRAKPARWRRCASWRCTTSTGAASSQRGARGRRARSRSGRAARAARPARLAPGRRARQATSPARAKAVASG